MLRPFLLNRKEVREKVYRSDKSLANNTLEPIAACLFLFSLLKRAQLRCQNRPGEMSNNGDGAQLRCQNRPGEMSNNGDGAQFFLFDDDDDTTKPKEGNILHRN